MAQITFGKPRNVTPGGLNGVVVAFPFSVLRFGQGALRDTVTQHRIRVGISGTLLASWNFSSWYKQEIEPDLVKTLFEFARQAVLSKLQDGTFKDNEEIELLTTTAPKQNPFAPSKIPNPEGATFEVTIAQGRRGMVRIFINYRRSDSSGYAGRIYDKLASAFDSENVFMDIDKIPFGVDFVDHIQQEVNRCDVLIALIGKNWLTTLDESGKRRIEDPNDFVRLEIEAALNNQLFIIPTLVGGASMPSSKELPDSLVKLARLNALKVSDRFHPDMDSLIRQLKEFPGLKRGDSEFLEQEIDFNTIMAFLNWRFPDMEAALNDERLSLVVKHIETLDFLDYSNLGELDRALLRTESARKEFAKHYPPRFALDQVVRAMYCEHPEYKDYAFPGKTAIHKLFEEFCSQG